MAAIGRPWIALVAIVSCLALLLTLRGGVKSSVPVYSDPAQVHPSSNARPEHVAPSKTKIPQKHSPVPTEACGKTPIVYPAWPEGFNVSVNAVFVVGEQKSGSTWLWEMLNAHPCLLTSAQPYKRMGAITTKETYYLTSTKIGRDAREFLVPWMGHRNRSYALSDDAWKQLDNKWFAHALRVAARGTAASSEEFFRARTYTAPGKKLAMAPCKQYFLLEATPHNLHTPIAAARIRKMFPNAIALASLKEPVWRMRSAYNQFVGNFKRDCSAARPASWCPVFKYYQLQAPTYADAIHNELAYMKARGCAFDSQSDEGKSWMECYGCAVMDPWRDRADDQHLWYPPYAPTAALGIYVEMLQAWLQYFPAKQMLAINYEDMVADPFEVVNRALRLIGVEEYTQAQWAILQPERLGFKGTGAHRTDAATQAAEAEAAAFFAPHNKRLAELITAHQWQFSNFKVDYGAVNAP